MCCRIVDRTVYLLHSLVLVVDFVALASIAGTMILRACAPAVAVAAAVTQVVASAATVFDAAVYD